MKVRNHLGADDVDVHIRMLSRVIEYEVEGQINSIERWGERLVKIFKSSNFKTQIQVLEVRDDGTGKILATRLRFAQL